MSYVSIYRRTGDGYSNRKSSLNIVREAATIDELLTTCRKFTVGVVTMYDLDNLNPVGTIFPSGRFSIREEYRLKVRY